MPLPLVGVLQVDDDGRVVDANDDAAQLFRCPPETLRAGSLALTVDGLPLRLADLERGATRLGAATMTAAGQSRRLAVAVTRLDGSVSVVCHEAHSDLEERLRASVSDFRELFAKVPASMLVYRNVRDEHGEVVDFELADANEPACAFLGRRRGELVGSRLGSVVEPRVVEIARRIAAELDAGAPVVTREIRDRGRIFLATSFRLTGDRFASMRLDVTDLQRARDIYERAERMEALGELASGVGHDFKNILWGIGLYARAIAVAHPEPDPAGAEAAQIGEAVGHGMALAAQLLEFARPARPDDGGSVDLAAVVDGIAPMLGRLLGDRRRLELRLASGLPVAIDPTRLEQVLINLIVNARDAMPDGGTVRLTGARATLSTEEALALRVASGGHALLEVADTGTGMDPAVATRVFEPYFTTKGAGKGTGLGLATSFATIVGAGGSITVETAPGRGSRFRIHLPLATTGVAAGPDRPSSSPAASLGMAVGRMSPEP